MSTWKKLAFTSDVGNLGAQDQTVPASVDRNINISGGSLNVLEQAQSAENYFKIAQSSITLGSTSGPNGNENAKLQCRNSVSFGAAWSNGVGGSGNVLGVNRFKATHSPLTLQNHSEGVNSQEFLKGPFFVMKNEGLNFGSNIAQALGLTVNGPNGLNTPTLYGGIQWDVTTVGQNIADATDPDYFNNFETKCTIATQKGTTGTGESDVLEAVNFVNALELTGGPDAADNAHTANEQTLSEVSFYGTELEALTRRNILTFQVGENGDISNSQTNDATESFLKGANGVPSQGSTFAGSVGIMAPFDGHIIAGNFSALRSNGVNANLHLEIDRIQPDNTVTSIRIASNNNTGDAKPKSNEYPFASPNTTRSSSLVVSAGDILIPKMIVDSLSGDYVLTDVFAQFYLYTESMIQS